jgi:hypothetical protein
MVIPRQTDVILTVYNRHGNRVFADTLRQVLPGAYVQRHKHYRWSGTDNFGNRLESGYYIYQMESDLAQRTGPLRISRLRRLESGKHPIFSSYYNLDDVPSVQSVSSRNLPDLEPGVYGAYVKGRLAVLYTEGYREKRGLSSGSGAGDADTHLATLRWATNVVMLALAEGSLARAGM